MAAKTILLSLALVAAAAVPDRAQDEKAWQQACTDFAQFRQSKDPKERVRAAEALAGISPSKHDKQVVQMILTLLQEELQRNDGKSEEKVVGAVLFACEDALKKVSDSDAVDIIVKQAKKGAPRIRFHICRALGAHKDAAKTLIELVDDRDPMIQIAAIDAIAAHKDPAAIDVLIKVLAAGDRSWEAKIAALGALAALGDKSDKVIDGLIEALGKCRPDETRVKAEIIGLLGKHLGVANPRTDDPGWWKDAKNNKDTPVKEGRTLSEPTKFFGLETKSARIVFILDQTISMEDPCTWPPMTETGGKPEADTEKLDSAEAAAKAQATALKKKFVEGKVTTRLDGLKRELVNTIYNLDKKVQFSIVWYAYNPVYWKEQLVSATWQTKLECLRDIEKIRLQNNTDIWGGIEAALRFVEVPNRPDVVRVDKKIDYATALRGADTFFLMTDGAHNTGKFVVNPGANGAPDVDAFIGEIKKVNALRKVIIHAIEIGDMSAGKWPLRQVDIDFMKKVAAATGGMDVHIGNK